MRMALSMISLATGARRTVYPTIEVAKSAHAALVRKGGMHIPGIVTRTLRLLDTPELRESDAARLLACALCSAAAGTGVLHELAPMDAGKTWEVTQDAIDAWFTSCQDDDLKAPVDSIASCVQTLYAVSRGAV